MDLVRRLVFFSWFWCFAAHFVSAESTLIGSVDLFAVVLLHPEMRNYRFELQRFEVWPESMATMAPMDREKIRQEIFIKVAQNLDLYQQKYQKELLEVNARIHAAGPYNTSLQEQIGNEFKERRQKERRALSDSALEFLTDGQKTREQFRMIWKKAGQAIARVAEAKGFASIAPKTNEHKILTEPVKENATHKLTPGHMFHDWERVLRLGFLSQESSGNFLEIQDWLSNGDKVRSLFRPWFGDMPIVLGSNDITADVIIEQTRSEGFEEFYANILASAYTFWKNRGVVSEYSIDFKEFSP